MTSKKDDVARQIVINLIRRWKFAERCKKRYPKDSTPKIISEAHAIEAWNSLQEAKKIYYNETQT